MTLDKITILYRIVVAHLIGDYVLQSRFLAENKGQNWYLLFVHCVLYTVPFAVLWGLDWKVAVIFVSHILVDPLKARYKKINLVVDQLIHYVIGIVLYLIV